MSSTLQSVALGAAVKVIPGAGAAVAVAKKIPVVGGVINSALQTSDPHKDASRLARQQDAWNKAVAGDVNAALYIRQLTGHFAIVTVPGYGQVGGPNAGGSDPAIGAARLLWQKVLALPNGVGKRAQDLYASIKSGGAAPGTPAATLAHVTSLQLWGIPAWVLGLVAVAAVVGYVLWRRR